MKAKELIAELQNLDPETDLYFGLDDNYHVYRSKFATIYEMWIEPESLNADCEKLICVENNPNDKFNTKITVIG